MKPLSKKARLGSGIFLGIIFVILAPIILADSFGYGWGKIEDAFTFVKKGGIYVGSEFSGVEIYIDGEYFKDSGLLIRNTLIQDLTPNQDHDVVAQKEGRHDWRKTLPVYESLVTEARVLMLPLEIETQEIYPFFDALDQGTTTATSTERLVKVDDLPEEILINGYIPTNPQYRDLINLFNEDKNDVYSTSTDLIDEKLQTTIDDIVSATTSTSTPEKDIPEYFVKLGIEDPEELQNLIELNDQVAWIENGDIVINWIDENEKPIYYYCLELEDCRNQIVLDWGSDIIKFDFLPGRFDVFVVLVEDGIYAVEIDDRSQRNIQPIYLGENLDFKIDRNNIVIKEGLVFNIIDRL
jgi:hypothetical protein